MALIYSRYDPFLQHWQATLYLDNGSVVEMPEQVSRPAVYTWVAAQIGSTSAAVKTALEQLMFADSWMQL